MFRGSLYEIAVRMFLMFDWLYNLGAPFFEGGTGFLFVLRRALVILERLYCRSG